MLAVRQISSENIHSKGKAYFLQHAARRTGEGGIGAGRTPETEAVPGMRLHRERHVFEGGELGINAGDLERARQALARALRRREGGDVLAREADAAGVGTQVAGELADQRGLAGAVGADDSERLAFLHLEIDVVRGAQRAEVLAKAFDLKHRA